MWGRSFYRALCSLPTPVARFQTEVKENFDETFTALMVLDCDEIEDMIFHACHVYVGDVRAGDVRVDHACVGHVRVGDVHIGIEHALF